MEVEGTHARARKVHKHHTSKSSYEDAREDLGWENIEEGGIGNGQRNRGVKTGRGSTNARTCTQACTRMHTRTHTRTHTHTHARTWHRKNDNYVNKATC